MLLDPAESHSLGEVCHTELKDFLEICPSQTGGIDLTPESNCLVSFPPLAFPLVTVNVLHGFLITCKNLFHFFDSNSFSTTY